MQPPRILIPLATYNELTPAKYGVNQAYMNAIVRAGGTPLSIARPSDEELREFLPLIDGIFLIGGCDIDPEHYHEKNMGSSRGIDHDRDRVEFTLIRHATEKRIPLLGVCRGAQVMNVAQGGSLYQDLFSEMENALPHDQHEDAATGQALPRSHTAHDVAITKDTFLSRIVEKDTIAVNSLHHQGVKTLGKGLVAGAIAPDGLIEAIELPAHPFALGVEWHPEELPDAPSANIFTAFIEACKTYQETKNKSQ